jgi:glycosyltransferase involved in cell wall biosynthesis
VGVEALSGVNKVCFFGGINEGYPRHELIRKGLEKRGVSVVLCAASPRYKWPRRYALLTAGYLRMKRDFDVILVTEFCHKDMVLAHFLGRMSGKPVVFDPLVSRYDTKVHDRGDARVGSYQAWHNRNLDRVSLALADLVLADTQAHADYYIEELGAASQKTRVLPVGADEDIFVPNGGSPAAQRPFVALFYGNYLPLHGVETIAEAAKILRAETDVRFVLVGNGQTFDGVRDFVEREGLDNVEMRGRVPFDSLPELLAGAHVSLGIFGRTQKTGRVVPNKVYQSMAAGRVVITADSPAVREVFRDNENICLVPAGDAAALADRIRALRDHPRTAAAIAAAGAELVRKRFSSMEIGDRFIACCQEVLNI